MSYFSAPNYSAGYFAVAFFSPLPHYCLRHFHPIYVDLSYVYPSYFYLGHALMGL